MEPTEQEHRCVRAEHRPRPRRGASGPDGHHGHQGVGAVQGRDRGRRRPRGLDGLDRPAAQGPLLRPRRGRRRRVGPDRLQGRPRHPAPLHRARDGAGGAAALPRGQARHRPAGHRRLLLRLRRREAVRPRGPRQDRDRDAQDHQGGSALRASRHHRRRRDQRAPGRALQDRAHRAQGLRQRRERGRGRERRGGRGRADHLRQRPPQRRRRLVRPVPRPAPAHHQADPRLQADAVGGGVLARRREEQDAAAHLRHRLGVQGGARGAPAPHRGGRAPRPTRSARDSRSSTPRAV